MKRAGSNLVLYAGAQPVFSTDPRSEQAAAEIYAAMSSARAKAESGGGICPAFRVCREDRTANEAGQQTSDDIQELSFPDLSPVKSKKEKE